MLSIYQPTRLPLQTDPCTASLHILDKLLKVLAVKAFEDEVVQSSFAAVTALRCILLQLVLRVIREERVWITASLVPIRGWC